MAGNACRATHCRDLADGERRWRCGVCVSAPEKLTVGVVSRGTVGLVFRKVLELFSTAKGGAVELVPFDAPLRPDCAVALIGDLHGCLPQAQEIWARVQNAAPDRIVFLGDYVDRGPATADTLRWLMALEQDDPRVICLRGNHEKMLLDFLDTPGEKGARWLRHGGMQSLESFGFAGLSSQMSGEDIARVSRDLKRILPQGMEAWLRGLPLSWVSGNLWAVHAAADPAVSMDAQSDRVLLWGHKAFHVQNRRDGQWVVHGHTIVAEPVARDGRISIDTGAYAGNALTAVQIQQDGALEFLQV